MSQILKPFQPREADIAGILSWIHIGDLHMTDECEQNDCDLQSIVSEINRNFADSVSFVYLPGDNADDGSNRAYAVARKSLDRLRVPWCAIIGDHDVHEKSFANFLGSMGQETHYSFCIGNVRFLALNAFDIPDPKSFAIMPKQMDWIKSELQSATMKNQQKVMLLHCYPSDLKTRPRRTHQSDISASSLHCGHGAYSLQRDFQQWKNHLFGNKIDRAD